ncbi:MAG: amidohydrolase [Rikenellaceae bacterium]
MKKAILLSKGAILTMLDTTPTQPKEGYVGVVDGRIVMVSYEESQAEEFLKNHTEAQIIECQGKIIMPGLINTHCHVAMTLMRNYADDMELMEWLTKHIWPFEAKLTDEDIAAGTRLGVAEMLMGGTTTFVDMYWSEYKIAEVVKQMGIRAMLTESVLDGREELFVRDMDRLREVAAESSRVKVGVGPHAPYTCSPATLQLAVEYGAKHGLPVTIHLSETTNERPMIEERYGCSPLEYIDKHGALSSSTILAHSIYLTEGEIQSIAQSGASVAHNAQSNMKLASGVAPITKMSKCGVNCTIATDGASSNNDLDMWEEMRTTQFLQRAVQLDALALPAYEILRMATLNGARAVGMEGELGIIKEGALADIITVDCSAPHMRPRHNLISALVYCAKAHDVCDVVVDGVVRLRNRQLIGENIEQICRDAEQRSQRIIDELKSN